MRTFITATFLLLAALPARAQTTGFVRGFGGVSFLSEPGAVLGGTVGIRLSAPLQAIGEVGALTNMLPQSIQRELDVVARDFGNFFGAPLTINLQAPGVYGFAGLRASHRVSSRMQVFAEGGAGLARGTSDIRARAGAVDVSSQLTAMLQIKRSITRPLLALGGGVSIPLTGRLSADVGYRYMRIFTDNPRINTAAMNASVNWSF